MVPNYDAWLECWARIREVAPKCFQAFWWKIHVSWSFLCIHLSMLQLLWHLCKIHGRYWGHPGIHQVSFLNFLCLFTVPDSVADIAFKGKGQKKNEVLSCLQNLNYPRVYNWWGQNLTLKSFHRNKLAARIKVTVCVSVTYECHNEVSQTGQLKQQNFACLRLWRLKV